MANFFILLHISTIWTFLITLDLTELHYIEHNFITHTILNSVTPRFPCGLTYFILNCFEKKKKIKKSITIVIIEPN
jgi:hypothetical protein